MFFAWPLDSIHKWTTTYCANNNPIIFTRREIGRKLPLETHFVSFVWVTRTFVVNCVFVSEITLSVRRASLVWNVSGIRSISVHTFKHLHTKWHLFEIFEYYPVRCYWGQKIQYNIALQFTVEYWIFYLEEDLHILAHVSKKVSFAEKIVEVKR